MEWVSSFINSTRWSSPTISTLVVILKRSTISHGLKTTAASSHAAMTSSFISGHFTIKKASKISSLTLTGSISTKRSCLEVPAFTRMRQATTRSTQLAVIKALENWKHQLMCTACKVWAKIGIWEKPCSLKLLLACRERWLLLVLLRLINLDLFKSSVIHRLKKWQRFKPIQKKLSKCASLVIARACLLLAQMDQSVVLLLKTKCLKVLKNESTLKKF